MSTRKVKVEIGAETKGLKSGLNDATGQVNNFGASIKKAAIGLGAAFGGAMILKGIKDMVTELTNAAGRFADLADMTGVSVRVLQEYAHIATIAGMNQEVFANATMGMTRRLQNLHSELSPVSRGLDELGINAYNGAGQLRNAGDITNDVIVALAGLENEARKNVLASQLFGGSWSELAPILKMGSKGIEEAKKEAHKLGLVMSDEAIVAADKLGQTMDLLNEQWVAMKRGIMIEAVPAMLEFVTALNQGDTAWHRMWKNFGENFVKITIPKSTIETYDELSDRLADVRKAYGDLLNLEITDGLNKGQKETRDYYEWLIPTLENQIAVIKKADEESKKKNTTTVEQLGIVETLQQQIAAAELAALKAVTKAEYDRHAARMQNLQKELEAFQARTPVTAPGAMTPLDSGTIGQADPFTSQMEMRTTASDNWANQHLANIERMRQAEAGFSTETEDAMEAIGASMANMVASGNTSANQMIKALMGEATAHLIKWIFATFPPPGSIALAMGAGAIVGGISSQIPAFADGGIVPPGFPNDSYLARLTSGETILPPGESLPGGGKDITVRGQIATNIIYLSNERFGRRKQLVE